MKTKTVTIYVAEDGKEFLSSMECIDYEKDMLMKKGMELIKESCKVRETCENCPFEFFCEDKTEPEYWKI